MARAAPSRSTPHPLHYPIRFWSIDYCHDFCRLSNGPPKNPPSLTYHFHFDLDQGNVEKWSFAVKLLRRIRLPQEIACYLKHVSFYFTTDFSRSLPAIDSGKGSSCLRLLGFAAQICGFLESFLRKGMAGEPRFVYIVQADGKLEIQLSYVTRNV